MIQIQICISTFCRPLFRSNFHTRTPSIPGSWATWQGGSQTRPSWSCHKCHMNPQKVHHRSPKARQGRRQRPVPSPRSGVKLGGDGDFKSSAVCFSYCKCFTNSKRRSGRWENSFSTKRSESGISPRQYWWIWVQKLVIGNIIFSKIWYISIMGAILQ